MIPTDEQIAAARAATTDLQEAMSAIRLLLGNARKAWSALEVVRVSDDSLESDEEFEQWNGATGEMALYNVVADLHDMTDPDRLKNRACLTAIDAMHERWRHESTV